MFKNNCKNASFVPFIFFAFIATCQLTFNSGHGRHINKWQTKANVYSFVTYSIANILCYLFCKIMMLPYFLKTHTTGYKSVLFYENRSDHCSFLPDYPKGYDKFKGNPKIRKEICAVISSRRMSAVDIVNGVHGAVHTGGGGQFPLPSP